jgi:hypothetical protein
MWSTSVNLQEIAEKNIRPMGENSPNLVALLVSKINGMITYLSFFMP